jgi:hypothetical protein
MGDHALEPSALGAARHVVAGQVSKGFAGFLHTYGAFGSAARHRGRFLPHGLLAFTRSKRLGRLSTISHARQPNPWSL